MTGIVRSTRFPATRRARKSRHRRHMLVKFVVGSDLLKEQTFEIPIRSRTVEDGRTNKYSHYINSTSKSLFILLPIYHKKLGNGLQKSSLSSEIENAQIEGPQVY